MMKNETLIEKYFSKHLSETELLEFEKRYETDQDFKDEVNFLKNVKSITEAESDAQFKNQLTSYEAEITVKQQSTSPQWLKPLLAVAAVLVIALSLTLFLNQEVNENKLYSTYFEPSKNVSSPIVRSETDEQLINIAFIAYTEKDYNQAIPLFAEAFEKTKNSELLFYEGNSLLALDRTEEAIEVFKKHLIFSDALTNRSHWYLALGYLKTKQNEKAKQELQSLINSKESFKKTEAKSLLKKLE